MARYHWPLSPIYQSLLQACKSKTWFVITSNADGMFEQNGFDLQKIFTIQGDYSRIQCLAPCRSDAVWPIKPLIEKALPFIDADTQELDDEHIPKCEFCKGDVMLNVNGGNWFLNTAIQEQQRAYETFLNTNIKSGKKTIILEIGAGFNTPGVIRFPMENLVRNQKNVKFIRINQEYPDIPLDLDNNVAMGIRMNANKAVSYLLD